MTFSNPQALEQSFALNQLDLKLKAHLNIQGGFFVEAGANDGISQSNTLYFEKYHNWKGILIEPIPHLAEKCRINRPNCIVENCALVPFNYSEPEIEMYYCNLVSMVKGAQKSIEQELAHIRRGCEVQNIDSYELTVPVRTLTSILDQHAIGTIDLLSLDVEGFELDVLKGIDFARYQPTYLLIEARYRDEIDSFLAPLYEPIAELSHHDVLYKSRHKIEEEYSRVISTPIAFFIFNRPDLTETVFNAIAEAKPQKLLVIADGPRSSAEVEKCEATRAIINRVSWECELLTNFAEENLGCKQRVSSGLDWVFSQVEEAIILEDDCLPSQSFFSYCQTLLEYYRHDDRIFLISGNNFQDAQTRTSYSYYFSRYPHIWGWASWRRAWRHFDLTMQSWQEYKAAGLLNTVFEDPYEQDYWLDILDQSYENQIDSWAYIWGYTCWSQNGLTILPEVNLVSNIGFRADATHTTINSDSAVENPLTNIPRGEIWDISHPPFMTRHAQADAYTFDHIFGGKQMKALVKQLQDALAHAHEQYQQSQQQQQQTQAQLQQTQAQLQQTQAQLQQTQVELQHSHANYQDTQANLEGIQNQLEHAQFKLKKLRTKLEQVKETKHNKLQELQTRLHEAEQNIIAMESSKFWKLRGLWLKIKKRLGLSSSP